VFSSLLSRQNRRFATGTASPGGVDDRSRAHGAATAGCGRLDVMSLELLLSPIHFAQICSRACEGSLPPSAILPHLSFRYILMAIGEARSTITAEATSTQATSDPTGCPCMRPRDALAR
jgi:hypothetical protein